MRVPRGTTVNSGRYWWLAVNGPCFGSGAFKGWVAVLGREVGLGGWRGSLVIARGVIRAGVSLVVHGAVSCEEWDRRVNGVCVGCPIYDAGLRRCRPYDGSGLGCGCWVPGLALVKKPYPKGCWAKQFLPGSGLGWD